jgi:hypothetical protein
MVTSWVLYYLCSQLPVVGGPQAKTATTKHRVHVVIASLSPTIAPPIGLASNGSSLLYVPQILQLEAASAHGLFDASRSPRPSSRQAKRSSPLAARPNRAGSKPKSLRILPL